MKQSVHRDSSVGIIVGAMAEGKGTHTAQQQENEPDSDRRGGSGCGHAQEIMQDPLR